MKRQRYPIEQMAKILLVSRSGYYRWLDREPSRREREDARLKPLIRQAHKKGRRSWGSSKIQQELGEKGITVGLISPGFVKTDFTPGLDLPMMITPEESATKVIAVIDDYDLSKTGTFLGKDGQTWPW